MLAACGSSPPVSYGPPSSSTPGSQPKSQSAATAAAQRAFPSVKGSQVIDLRNADPYTPQVPPGGGTDDYHCTVVNPHLTGNRYIIGSHFYPNSPEVHHAILFEVPPTAARAALAADRGGKGWSCFGDFNLGVWLAVWAPGHGVDLAPRHTGFYFPKGSLVIMQVHYNMLAGDKPTNVDLKLQTVPAAPSHPTPLHLDLLIAAPDIPCPANVHGPLCNRAASLRNLGQQFGAGEVGFVDGLEQQCGRNPANPPGGDTTSCTSSAGFSGKILRIQPHMHLLGVGMKVILNPGTPHARVLLDDTHYNFDYQRSFDMPTPVVVTPQDTLEVTCTYKPTLRQELPQLRRLPPRYVTWGDGSSEEMCLGILTYVSSGSGA